MIENLSLFQIKKILFQILFFSKIINFIYPDTIDSRGIYFGDDMTDSQKQDNLNLAIQSANVSFTKIR